MICDDQHIIVVLFCSFNYSFQSLINRFDGFDGGLHIAGVPDPLRIGKVDHNKLMLTSRQTLYYDIAHLRCIHFRFKIVRRYSRTWNHTPVCPRTARLSPTVEEVGYVRILFCLSYSQLPKIFFAQIFTKCVVHSLGRKCYVQEWGKKLIVGCKRGIVQTQVTSFEGDIFMIKECLGYLACPVSPDIIENDNIPFPDTGILFGLYKVWFQKFISRSGCVTFSKNLFSICSNRSFTPGQ